MIELYNQMGLAYLSMDISEIEDEVANWEKIKGGIGLIIVSDTTPLISLMKIGQLDLVNHLFGEVQIPNAVYEELVSNTRFPDESICLS